MQSARLKLYYNYLGNFDFIDKTPQTSKFSLTTPKLNNLNIKSNLDKHQFNKGIVIKSLILEVFGNQRFFIKKTEGTFLKSLFFELTLRKENLFLFLDSCLNTVFLTEYKFLSLNNINIEDNLPFYLNNDLMNYFVVTSGKFKYSIQFFKPPALLKRSLGSWSFYPVPTNKLKLS